MAGKSGNLAISLHTRTKGNSHSDKAIEKKEGRGLKCTGWRPRLTLIGHGIIKYADMPVGYC